MNLVPVSIAYQKPKAQSFDEMYMQLAVNMAKLSTCARVQVGAVLVVDERPLLSGYNGSPRGHRHCTDVFYDRYQESCYEGSFEEFMQLPKIKAEHGVFSRLHEIHAEVNIIAQAAYKGLATKKGKLYVTCSPCNDCCKSILTAGISEVVFKDLYDRETEGLEILVNSGIKLRQLELIDSKVKENILWQLPQ